MRRRESYLLQVDGQAAQTVDQEEGLKVTQTEDQLNDITAHSGAPEAS